MRYCDRWVATMKSGADQGNRLLKGAWMVVILLGIVFVIQVMDYRATLDIVGTSISKVIAVSLM